MDTDWAGELKEPFFSKQWKHDWLKLKSWNLNSSFVLGSLSPCVSMLSRKDSHHEPGDARWLKRYIRLASDNHQTTLEATDAPPEVSAAVLRIQNRRTDVTCRWKQISWLGFWHRETQGGARPLVPTHSASQAVLALTLTTKQPAITPH